MKLKQGDQILVNITKVSGSTVFADAGQWSNISKIEVNPEVAATVLSPGRELVVAVDRIEGDRAITSQVRGTYSRQHRPGDVIEATAGEHIKHHLCEGVPEERKNVDRLLLPQARPGDEVEARIEKLRDGLVVATVSSVLDAGIREGDLIEARTVRGKWKARTLKGQFELKIDRFAHSQTVIRARIKKFTSVIETEVEEFGELPTVGDKIPAVTVPGTSEVQTKLGGYRINVKRNITVEATVVVKVKSVNGQELIGKIVDSGALPEEGNVVQANVKEGQRSAKVVEAGYDVQLAHESLSSGEVTIEINTVSGENFEGTIRSYCDTIPQTDEKIEAFVRKTEGTADPANYDCTIVLRDEVPQYGNAIVEITEISDLVYGKVVNYEKSSDDNDPVGSKNELLNGTSF